MTGLYHKKEIIFQNTPCEESYFEYDVPSGGDLSLVFVCIGSLATNHIRVKLGKGCNATIYGLYVNNGTDKTLFDVVVEHAEANSTSRQLFKGILADNALADFSGLIKVDFDSQKTQAYQENHTVLLHDTARINTKPQLEIYADDVSCSHGATVGKLNEDELFYLRSRGISLPEAKKLQQLAFLAEVMEQIDDESIVEAVNQKLNSL